MKIQIKESVLKTLILEAIDNVLYPRGGSIGGEHEKPISDKDFIPNKIQNKFRSDSRGFIVAQEKWKERFKDYFGTDDYDAVFDFLKYMKGDVENYKAQLNGLYFRNAEANIINRLFYNPDVTEKGIINNFGLNAKNPESIRKFALEIFPQMEYEYKEFMKNDNFGQY